MKNDYRSEADFERVEDGIGIAKGLLPQLLEEARAIKRELLPMVAEVATAEQMSILSGLTYVYEWKNREAKKALAEKDPEKKAARIRAFLDKVKERHHYYFQRRKEIPFVEHNEYNIYYPSGTTPRGYVTYAKEEFHGTIRQAHARAERLAKIHKCLVTIEDIYGDFMGEYDEQRHYEGDYFVFTGTLGRGTK